MNQLLRTDILSYNIVLKSKNWVMEKLANHFNKYLKNSKISYFEDFNSDINFYFNWHAMTQKTHFDVCFFTHIEDQLSKRWWNNTTNACDVGVLIGNKYINEVPENKRIVFHPPPFNNFLPQKQTKVLVVGRAYSSGRKNFEIKKSLDKLNNIKLIFTEGKLSEAELKDAYLNTDYVLVTSKIEGGPMCVIEAIAMNKPVIAPDVGWCWEYPVIKYSNEQELLNIFEKLHIPINSWENRVRDLDLKIQKLYKNKTQVNNSL